MSSSRWMAFFLFAFHFSFENVIYRAFFSDVVLSILDDMNAFWEIDDF